MSSNARTATTPPARNIVRPVTAIRITWTLWIPKRKVRIRVANHDPKYPRVMPLPRRNKINTMNKTKRSDTTAAT